MPLYERGWDEGDHPRLVASEYRIAERGLQHGRQKGFGLA